VAAPVAMIGLAEKGFANIRVSVRGKAGHSSMPGRGTTAGALAAALSALERSPFPARMTRTVDRFFAMLSPHARFPVNLGLRFRRLLWPLLRRMLSTDPATDALIHTTLAITVLRSGEIPNVLPAEAQAAINLRLLPGETARGALVRIQRMVRRAVRRDLAVEVDFLPGSEPSDPVPESSPDDALWRALVESVRDIAPRAVAVPFLVVVATDSRRFAQVADALVRFLPVSIGAEEVARIHGVDERISLENYAGMIAFYEGLIRRVSADPIAR
jgi:carboxypeptidase PM20D1